MTDDTSLYTGSAAPNDGAVNRTHDCVEKCDKGVCAF